MPGCAAIGCNNRSEKGYTMKCFPRDPILRQIWKDRVGRADWEPSNNSFLCHAHFAPSQWMVTQCGRLKLRKGAIPSIFRVVSTRKSPNKRRRSGADDKSEEDELGLEILENDEKNYVYLETSGRFENFGDESIVFLDSENSSILPNSNGKEGNSMNNVYQIIRTDSLDNLQHENVIVIADDNSTEIPFVNSSNNYIIINSENENTINNLQPMEILTNHIPTNSRIKVEVKDEATVDEIYDEVESNMERIYEGINTDDESTNQNGSNLKVYVNQSRKTSKETEASNFSWQNGDSVLSGQTTVDENAINACLEINKSNNSINREVVTIEDTENEENLEIRETEEMSNLEAALLRKRKAREETMKSIEKFISDTVDETVEKSQDCSDSEISNANSNSSKRSKSNKFTLQFPESIDDVSDIMRDLGEKSSMECSLETNKSQECEDECITSVLTLQNNLSKVIKTERKNDSSSEGNLSDELVKSSSKFPLKQERVEVISSGSEFNDDLQNEVNNQDENFHSDQDLYLGQNQHQEEATDYQVLDEDHEDYQEQSKEIYEDQDSQDAVKQGSKKRRNSDSDCRIDSTDLYYDLKLTIEQQKGTILKLTDHLTAYNDMENKVLEVKDELKLKNKEISILSAKLNRKEATQGRSEKNFSAMQALIKDLTQKVKTIEDVNRRLSRSISVEHQNKKNLEYQVRSREKTIKELNWKVNKASKLLERADKNANNYKRRVNNMRSLIKRKHLDLDHDKQTPFDSLFSDYVKHEFSDESLRMAARIQKMCGTSGYEVLLNYNFPLPSPRTLRRRLQKNVFANGSIQTINQVNSNSVNNIDIINLETNNLNNTNFDIDDCEIIEVNQPETSLTVTGTVQDIFNENNNSDLMSEYEEMSESELQEHLDKFMNVHF